MKRTYQPSKLVRKRRHGFRARMATVGGRKVARRAVDRNRIRRKLREAVRAQGDALDAHDVVLRVTRARRAGDTPARAGPAGRAWT